MEKRDVVDRILMTIKQRGGKAYKTDGNYKPDIFGCYKGVCLCIECKDVGKMGHVSEGQEIEIKNWQKAGAIAFATDNPDQVYHMLDTIDSMGFDKWKLVSSH